MNTTRIRRAAVAAVAAVALAGVTAACEDTTATGSDSGSKASASKGKDDKGAAPSKSVAEEFKAYVAENGTAGEKEAVKHVLKVQGADKNNDILDTADIHTDLEGDLMNSESTGTAKQLASAFADFQASRGKESKNGLVTVYSASGDMLSNGQY